MYSGDAATEMWRPAPRCRDSFDDLVIMVNGGHFPSPSGEDQHRAGVEGEVGGDGAERVAAGEESVLLDGAECRVEAVVVHCALAERSEEQGAIGSLDKDFRSAKITEQGPELGRCQGREGAARPA